MSVASLQLAASFRAHRFCFALYNEQNNLYLQPFITVPEILLLSGGLRPRWNLHSRIVTRGFNGSTLKIYVIGSHVYQEEKLKIHSESPSRQQNCIVANFFSTERSSDLCLLNPPIHNKQFLCLSTSWSLDNCALVWYHHISFFDIYLRPAYFSRWSSEASNFFSGRFRRFKLGKDKPRFERFHIIRQRLE